jgi:hypothetical protein
MGILFFIYNAFITIGILERCPAHAMNAAEIQCIYILLS